MPPVGKSVEERQSAQRHSWSLGERRAAVVFEPLQGVGLVGTCLSRSRPACPCKRPQPACPCNGTAPSWIPRRTVAGAAASAVPDQTPGTRRARRPPRRPRRRFRHQLHARGERAVGAFLSSVALGRRSSWARFLTATPQSQTLSPQVPQAATVGRVAASAMEDRPIGSPGMCREGRSGLRSLLRPTRSRDSRGTPTATLAVRRNRKFRGCGSHRSERLGRGERIDETRTGGQDVVPS